MAERGAAMFELGLRDYGTSWMRLQEALSVQQQLYGPTREKSGTYIPSLENEAPAEVSAAVISKKGKQPSSPVSRTASSESEKSTGETSPKATKTKGLISLITRSKDSNTGKKAKKASSKGANENSKAVDGKEKAHLSKDKRTEPEEDAEETLHSLSVRENGTENRESSKDGEIHRSSNGHNRRHGSLNSPDYKEDQHEYSRKDSLKNDYPRERVKERSSHQKEKEKYDRVRRETSRDYKESSRKDSLSPSDNQRDRDLASFKEHVSSRLTKKVEERCTAPSVDSQPEFGSEEFTRDEKSPKLRNEKPRRSRELSNEDLLDHSLHRRRSQEPLKDEDYAERNRESRGERHMNFRLSREQSMEDEVFNRSPTTREAPVHPTQLREPSKNDSLNGSSSPARDDRMMYQRISRDAVRNGATKEHRIVSPPRGSQRNSHTNGDYPRHYEPPPGRDHVFRFSTNTTRDEDAFDYKPPSPNIRNSLHHAPDRKGDIKTVNNEVSPPHKAHQEYRRVSREVSRETHGKDLLDDDDELMIIEPASNTRPRLKSQTEQQLKSPSEASKPQVMKCVRCSATVYPMELVTPKPGVLFHSGCFKCRECGVKLTLQTYFTNQRDTRDTDVYCRTHQPRLGPGTVDGNALNILTSKNSKDIKFSRYSKGSDAEILLSSKVIAQKDDFDVLRKENGGLRYI